MLQGTRSGLTGLGCWSDAFCLHPDFVPAGPRDVESLKPHRIFHHFADRPKVGMGYVVTSLEKGEDR